MDRIIFVTTLFPNTENPHFGIFNLARCKALQNNGFRLKVVVLHNFSVFRKFLLLSFDLKGLLRSLKGILTLPKIEIYEGIEVQHLVRFSLPNNIAWSFDVYSVYFFNHSSINELIDSFKPSIVMTSWLHPVGTYFAKYHRRGNFKLISFIEGSDYLLSAKKFDKSMSITKSLSRCDVVIAVSLNLANSITNEVGLNNVCSLPNFYDERVFFFKKLRKQEKCVRLVSVGGLIYIKGHDILLEALRHVKFKYELIIIGEGPLMKFYSSMISKYNLNVKLLGTMTPVQISKVLDQSDLFIMPSRSESFGIAAVEAMASGLPVIASAVGGLMENIKVGFSGFLFKVEDINELAETLIKAVNYQWDRQNIASQAYQQFSEIKWLKI